MKDKLRELAKWCTQPISEEDAEELSRNDYELGLYQGQKEMGDRILAILDAEGDSGAVGDRMSDELRSFIEGMSVSVDVSTGEGDAGNRYFGTVTEVMDCADDKHGVTLLVQDAEPNFKPSPAVAIGFRHRMKGSAEWSYNYHRAPDSFELRECEIEAVWSGQAHPARPGVVSNKDVEEAMLAYNVDCHSRGDMSNARGTAMRAALETFMENRK